MTTPPEPRMAETMEWRDSIAAARAEGVKHAYMSIDKLERLVNALEAFGEALEQIADEAHLPEGGTLACYIRGDCECDQKIAGRVLNHLKSPDG